MECRFFVLSFYIVWRTIGVSGVKSRSDFTPSIQLRSCWDVVVDHEEVKVFFAVFLVDSADDHAAGIEAHHFLWWQVGDSDEGFADEFLWFVVFVDAGEDGSVAA